MLVALPAGHALCARDRVALSELAGERWVAGTVPDGLIERACRSAGFAPAVAVRADAQPVIRRAVATGLAVTLVPALAATSGAGVAFRPLAEPALTRRVYLVAAAARPRPPATQVVVDALRAAGARHGRRAAS